MQQAEDIVDQRTVRSTGAVAAATQSAHAGDLKRMLIGKDMVYLLGIGRAAGRHGDIHGLEVADINIDDAAVGHACPAAAGRRIAGEDRVRSHIEAAAIATYACNLHAALVKDDIVGLVGLCMASGRSDSDVYRREDRDIHIDHTAEEDAIAAVPGIIITGIDVGRTTRRIGNIASGDIAIAPRASDAGDLGRALLQDSVIGLVRHG